MHGRGACGRRVCIAGGGVHDGGDMRRRGCECQGHAWWGACVVGGMRGGVGTWQERQPLKWVVHILLECILVAVSFWNSLTTERCEGCKKVKRFWIKCSGSFNEINRWPIRYKQTSRGHFSPLGPIQFHAFFCNNLQNSRLSKPPPPPGAKCKKKDTCVFSINDFGLPYGTVFLSVTQLWVVISNL